MRIVDFKDESIFVRINEQVASAVPMNPKGVRVLKEIQLTVEEFDSLKGELADFCKGGIVAPPVWALFITVDGKSPWGQPAEASKILVPA